MTPLDKIVASLSEAQRKRALSFAAMPKQMGIGLTHFLPGMVERVGLNHPIFGSHHQLTPLGKQVADHLRRST